MRWRPLHLVELDSQGGVQDLLASIEVRYDRHWDRAPVRAGEHPELVPRHDGRGRSL
ncbi:MAG TPA: hypothetical protein VHK22_05535 [Gaiellaceae bacterium]|nr:hypothetical protein [Gaiellaceae bacterium]